MTHCERSGYWIEADVDLMDEVRGVADACHWTPRVDVILPAVQFLIVFEREKPPLVFRLEQKAIRLEICPFDVCNIGQLDEVLVLR